MYWNENDHILYYLNSNNNSLERFYDPIKYETRIYIWNIINNNKFINIQKNIFFNFITKINKILI